MIYYGTESVRPKNYKEHGKSVDQVNGDMKLKCHDASSKSNDLEDKTTIKMCYRLRTDLWASGQTFGPALMFLGSFSECLREIEVKNLNLKT